MGLDIDHPGFGVGGLDFTDGFPLVHPRALGTLGGMLAGESACPTL
jgi:hypothetical protein